jgi:hypothetical protein
MDEEQFQEGDNRARFLDGIGKEHLLILWDLGDQEGVLGKFLSKLSPEVAVSCDNISTDTSDVQNPRKMTEEQRDSKRFRESVLASLMVSISMTVMLAELRESENLAFKLQEQSFQTTTEEATKFYDDRLKKEFARIEVIKEEINRIKRRRVD